VKQRIPPDVERLMWLVAESAEPGAALDFQRRFPELSAELAQRRRMVADLKGAKNPIASEHAIPSFRPRSAVAMPQASRGIWLAGTVALAALAVASYSVTKWVANPVPKLSPPPVVRTDNPTGDGGVVFGPKQIGTPEPKTPQPETVNQQPAQEVPRTEQAKSLKLSNTSLVAALKMIGSNAGYNVDVAPGFADQTVSIDYVDYTTTEMLRDLGSRYNFTAFDQGDGTIIIVPAVDTAPPSDDLNGSQRHIGG
jgi:hypothetical protein